MKNTRPLKLMVGELGKELIGHLRNFVFVLANALIFSLFSYYFDFSISGYTLPLFVLTTLLAFLLFGEISRPLSFFWWFAFFALAFLEFYHPWPLVIFVVGTIVPALFWYAFSGKEGPSSLGITREMVLKFLVSLPRILFFNISYELFPLLFIWLGVTGISYLLGFVSIVGNGGNFIQIIVVSGVMFGFLQYYMKRHEEEVQKKVNSAISKQVQAKGNFSFDEFQKFIEEGDEHEEFVELCKEVTSNKEWMKALGTDFRVSRTQGKEVMVDPDFILLGGSENRLDRMRFRKLERLAEDKGKDIFSAYEDFFHSKKEEVLDELDRERIHEMSWTLLGNITILGESIPSLFSIEEKMDEEPETYSDYYTKTWMEIVEEAISVAMGAERSSSESQPEQKA